jgi:hypothetical protein
MKVDLVTAQAKVEEQAKELKVLQETLDELVTQKQADTDLLLLKFSELLNTKKKKIREQMDYIEQLGGETGRTAYDAYVDRVSKTPGIEEEEPEEPKGKGKSKVVAPMTKPASRNVQATRGSKRKASQPADEELSGQEDIEMKMEVDDEPDEPSKDSDGEDRRTTDRGSETESGPGDDSEVEPALQPARPRAPPPRRELPFANEKPAVASKASKKPESETESDDEL